MQLRLLIKFIYSKILYGAGTVLLSPVKYNQSELAIWLWVSSNDIVWYAYINMLLVAKEASRKTCDR